MFKRKVIPVIDDLNKKIKAIVEKCYSTAASPMYKIPSDELLSLEISSEDVDNAEIVKIIENGRHVQAWISVGKYEIYYKEYFYRSMAVADVWYKSKKTYVRENLRIEAVDLLGRMYKDKNIFHSHYKELYSYLFDKLVEYKWLKKSPKNVFRMMAVKPGVEKSEYFATIKNVGSFKYTERVDDDKASIIVYNNAGEEKLVMMDVPKFYLIDRAKEFRHKSSITLSKCIDAIKQYSNAIGFSENPVIISNAKHGYTRYIVCVPEPGVIGRVLAAAISPSGKMEVSILESNKKNSTVIDMSRGGIDL